jgi:hypothetical protein
MEEVKKCQPAPLGSKVAEKSEKTKTHSSLSKALVKNIFYQNSYEVICCRDATNGKSVAALTAEKNWFEIFEKYGKFLRILVNF